MVEARPDSAAEAATSAASYQCAHCDRRFARVDHLTRHVRTHTKEKPHRCPTCGKCFARADLLQRHSWRHAAPDQRQNALHGPGVSNRASKACTACSAAKLRCDNQRPCPRCVTRGLSCDADESGRALSRPRSHTSPASGVPQRPSNMFSADKSRHAPHADGELASIVDACGDDSNPEALAFDAIPSHGASLQPGLDDSMYGLDPNDSTQALLYTDFLKDLLFTSPQENDFTNIRGVQAPMLWDQPMDLGFDFSQALADVPFGEILPISTSILPQAELQPTTQGHDAPTPNQRAIAAGAQAFSTSVWHWVPSPTDHITDEQSTLALPSDTPSDSPEFLALSADVLSKRLEQSDREKVLSILLERCDRNGVVRIATAFPSHLLMEKLLHAALHFQTVGTVPFIHVATFDPSTISSELLTTLVAYGSFLSPVSATQRLAAAMADILFLVVPDRFCSNNARTRDLQLLQSFALFVYILSWSGSKRRTEIGESFSQPLVTMLRRANSTSRHGYKQIQPRWDDSNAELEAKWRAWAEQESKIRLVHHVFMHDAQSSMTHFTNPLFNAVEMTLPLPCAAALWEARDSLEWRERYFKLSPGTSQPHNLSTQAHEFVASGSLPAQPPMHCEKTTDTLTLFGIWHLVWTHQTFKYWRPFDGLSSGMQDSVSSLGLTTLMQALNSAQNRILHSNDDQVRRQIANLMMTNFLQMTLHAPVKTFPVVAGKDGEGEARRVYPMLQEWANDREGRQAIWHAGQVIRHGRTLSPSQTHMFFAVAIYHASLTLWTFSIIASARHQKLSQPHDQRYATHGLQLDGDANAEEVKKYVAIGDRSPSISIDRNGDSNASVPLISNPGAAMRAGIVTFSQTFGKAHGLPTFVESLVRLMEDLSKAAQSLGFG